MQNSIQATAIALILGLWAGMMPLTAQAGVVGDYEVTGVEAEDMLKMRAGPGIGYRILLGLPNGTILRVHSCEQSGGTRWCKVSLKQARSFRGYVSWAYLRKI